jgi:hypothetical protein
MSKPYLPGFHIFLDLEGALEYGEKDIYEVEFTDVIAFGTNSTRRAGYKNCVVANRMKILKKLGTRVYNSIICKHTLQSPTTRTGSA